MATVFGVLGYVMRRHGWPRVPLAIGFVLGAAFETNLLLTLRLQELGRIDILQRPIALGLATFTLADGVPVRLGFSLVAARLASLRAPGAVSRYGDAALALGLTAVMAWLMMQTLALGAAARFVPWVTIAVTLAILVAESVRELSRAMRAPDRRPSGNGLRLRELRAVGWIGASFCLIALLGAAGGTAHQSVWQRSRSFRFCRICSSENPSAKNRSATSTGTPRMRPSLRNEATSSV